MPARSARQAIAAREHGSPFGRGPSTFDQILEMGERGERGGAVKPLIEADLDRLLQARDIRLAALQAA